MASKDKERVEDEEEETPKPTGNKKKGILKWVLIIGGIVLLVGVSVGTSIFFMSNLMHGKNTQEAAATGTAPAKQKDDKGKPKQQRQPIYYKMDPPFVVNFQGPTGNRFLQVTIEMMTYDPDVVPAIEEHMPVIRNNLVFLLSSVNYDQISTLEGKQKLRADTLTEIQRVLKDKIGKPGVEEVYFTSIVMQ